MLWETLWGWKRCVWRWFPLEDPDEAAAALEEAVAARCCCSAFISLFKASANAMFYDFSAE